MSYIGGTYSSTNTSDTYIDLATGIVTHYANGKLVSMEKLQPPRPEPKKLKPRPEYLF